MSLKDEIFQTLVDHGVELEGADAPHYGIHSWRCNYYKDLPEEKGGGPCTCFDELLEALVEAAKRYNVVT